MLLSAFINTFLADDHGTGNGRVVDICWVPLPVLLTVCMSLEFFVATRTRRMMGAEFFGAIWYLPLCLSLIHLDIPNI